VLPLADERVGKACATFRRALVSNPIRYLSREHVRSLLPAAAEQIDLTARTYETMAAGRVQLPPKPGLHPRADGWLHAMPVYLEDEDVVALKWVGGRARNTSRGLPYISGLIALNDPETSRVVAVMDAAEITAARTAAASGVCIRRFVRDGWSRVAIIGFGAQGQAHARLLDAMNPGVSIAVYSRTAPETGAFAQVTSVSTVAEAVAGADIVVTALPLASDHAALVDVDAVPDGVLVLPLDFDTSVDRELVNAAALYVDDVGQFEHYRELGHFTGWQAPLGSVGDALATSERPVRPLCCNLGVGALDAAFAAVVLERALAQGVGVELER
jgi:ornithine cyclodeaminase/alanine dehydrogenase